MFTRVVMGRVHPGPARLDSIMGEVHERNVALMKGQSAVRHRRGDAAFPARGGAVNEAVGPGSDRTPHPWVGEGRRVRFGLAYGPLAEGKDAVGFVRLAEALGFDSFWAADHPRVSRDCWTSLAALAARTERIRLGTLVCCAHYRSPAYLARLAADVDRLSGGRLVLGLGIGDDPGGEFAQWVGRPLPSARERLEALVETVEIVHGLWGEAPFSYAGRHFRVDGLAIRPGPVQRPRVPVLIAGGGERGTLRQVARYADVSNFGSHDWLGGAFGVEGVQRKFDVLRGHCDAIGRPYVSVLRSHTTLPVLLAETPEALRAKLERSPHQGFLKFFASSALVGTPGEAVAYYRSLIEAGVRYFIAGLLGDDVETIRLLAEQVMPELAALTAEDRKDSP
jgi:alkanesulfonate monooxygenase SsuD/methylene tetrahydromethanopterin reductase-like flavin-dependent oxidoreductase (luciferase family)